MIAEFRIEHLRFIKSNFDKQILKLEKENMDVGRCLYENQEYCSLKTVSQIANEMIQKKEEIIQKQENR